ncbi:hypothetical protein EJB05_05860, partial [Eragrostis curvula]
MGPSRKSTPISCVLLLFVGFLAELVQGSMVPALYVLGDSQADVGNNNYRLSLLKANFPYNGIDFPGHKATGRFSNGYNFVDFLANSLGLPSPPAYHSICDTTEKYSIFLNGVNFASGGAGVSDLTNKGQCFSFSEQIDCDYFNVSTELVKQLGQPQAQAHLFKSIFTIAIGGNDIINSVLLPVDRLPILSSSQHFIESLAQTLKSQMERMYELGMRKLFFVGAAPLGCVPLLRERSLTKQCHAEANSLSVKYNIAAASLLRDMSTQHPDFRYSFFDTSTALLKYIQEPEANGFAEVKAACCGLGDNNAMSTCNPASKYCANRTSHMFWDVVHPTETTARKLMSVAFDGSEPFISPVNVRQLAAM